MSLLLAVVRFCAIALALGAGTMALLGALGFAVPALDVLNHLQIPIFYGTLIGIALVVFLVPAGTWRWIVLGISGAGFLASAYVFVPEVAWSMMPRPALPADGRPVLKAMTHNLFGLNYDMKRVAANIFAEDPDIVAFQEYFPEQREPLHPMLLAKYPYFAFCVGGKRANIGLYSKLPFTHTEQGACSETGTRDQRTSRIVATFTLEGGYEFSVMTTHLDWPFPVARQFEQREGLEAAINEVKGPLLVMGDMNSTPWSYAMRGMIHDTGIERQTRNLITYPLEFTMPDGLMRTIPFLPLDQVFTRSGIEVHELHAGHDDGSDHLPVIFTFSVPKSGS